MSEESGPNPKFVYDDLREWLAAAEALGEVRTVTGASWEEDIGLAAEAVLRNDSGPCVVFDEVPGCPRGFRLLMNLFAGKRRNMTMGFPGSFPAQAKCLSKAALRQSSAASAWTRCRLI